MLGLLLRKTTIEIWDHAVLVFLLNLVLLSLVLAMVLGLLALGPLSPLAMTLLLLGAGGIAFQALLAGQRLLNRIVAHREPGRWWHEPGDGALALLALAPLAGLLALALLLGDTALGLGGLAGIAGLTTAFWLFVVWLQLAFLVVPAILDAEGRPGLVVRWLALLVFDNPWFSLALIAIALPALVLGLGLLPGPFGLLLLATNALRLRLRRYAQGDFERPDWATLLAAERERLDRRRPISVLQPWRG